MKTMRCLVVMCFVLAPMLLAASLVAADDRCGLTPAGTWTVKVDFNFIADPSKPDETVKFYLQSPYSFTADGRVITLLPTGDGHPNVGDTRIGCLGDWRALGRGGEIGLVMRCYYNQAWDGIYGEIRGKGRVYPNGKLKVKFTYIDYNGDGSLNYDQGWGYMLGEKLR